MEAPATHPFAHNAKGWVTLPDGNLWGDGNYVYNWNAFSKLKWAAPSGTPTCGTSGNCFTYDAFGRIVETSNGSTWTECWLTPTGAVIYMNGATPNFAYWPTSQGGTALIGGNGSSYAYMHKDWLGSTRVVSSLTSNTVLFDTAYSPYGEMYATFGTNNAQYQEFASLFGNSYNGAMWDTDNRELSNVGRWLSPDPAGSGWNQYAYATNPNSFVDPTGLGNCPNGQVSCGGPPSGPGGEGCTDRSNPNPTCRNSPMNPGIPDDPFSFIGIDVYGWGYGPEYGWDWYWGSDWLLVGDGPADAANNGATPSQQQCLATAQGAVNSDLGTQSNYLGPTQGMDSNGMRGGAYNFNFFAPGVTFGPPGPSAVPGAPCGRFGDGLHVPVPYGPCNLSGDPTIPGWGPGVYNGVQGSFLTAHIDSSNPFQDLYSFFAHLINNVILQKKHGC